MHEADSLVETSLDRRKFLRLGAAAAAAPAVVGGLVAERARAAQPHQQLEEMTIAELQAQMTAGRLRSQQLVDQYQRRIEALDDPRGGAGVNSVLELNPDAEAIARSLDDERRAGRVRGPLHGIPLLIKGNIDTGDRMTSTAGSLALVGAAAPRDATVAAKLRDAGAVILGKANLSEWANFRSFHSSSGWSGRGGQTANPYVVDRNPCGSSCGSGAAVAASFCAAALATETDGSIVCPAHQCGVVGIKPTVGLTSRAGVVPISHSQDTIGPHGRTVADAAAVLERARRRRSARSGHGGERRNFPDDYTQFLDPNGLRGARIGVMRAGVTGYSEETDAVFEEALGVMRSAGAVLVDPADLPTIDEINSGAAEITVLVYEFKRDLEGVSRHSARCAADARGVDPVQPRERRAGAEVVPAGVVRLRRAEPVQRCGVRAALPRARGRSAGGRDRRRADGQQPERARRADGRAGVADRPRQRRPLPRASSGPAAIAGYPIVQVPAGDAFGLPVGISFIGTAWSEPTLIRLASGFENAARARRKPEFLATLPTDVPRRRGRRNVKAPSTNRQLVRNL